MKQQQITQAIKSGQTGTVGSEVLARWTYTRDEWTNFRRWRLRKKSWFHYLCFRLQWRSYSRVPEITITSAAVFTNQQPETFHEGKRHFQRVTIRDAGKLNIMEISYENGNSSKEIRIPIPKGKLREAIAVQEKLLTR